MLKKIGLVIGGIIAIFAASNVVQSFKDYSNAQEMYASTTDVLIAELKERGRADKKPWPPKGNYYEERRRWRDSISQVVVRETPDDPKMLCDQIIKDKITGRFNEYFERKLNMVRYALHAAGEREAREAEVAWETSTTVEAEARIAATLKSGRIRVRDVRREYFGEARRLLGPDDPSPQACP